MFSQPKEVKLHPIALWSIILNKDEYLMRISKNFLSRAILDGRHRDHPHMTSLFRRGGGLYKIVTHNDMRAVGWGFIQKSDITKECF